MSIIVQAWDFTSKQTIYQQRMYKCARMVGKQTD